MLVHRMLEASADRAPDVVLLAHGHDRFTYADVESRANRLAALLAARGVARGDRVGLLAENGIEYLAGFFGILKAGGCVVALNSANKPHTSRQLLADSGAVGLVTRVAQVRRDLPETVVDCPALRFVVTDRTPPKWELPAGIAVLTPADVAARPADRPAVALEPADLAAILYTSGSTGVPRGATLTHGNLCANTRQILDYLHLTADDSVLVVLPFHYSFGNSLLLTHVKTGGRLVVDNRFAYPQVIVETLEAERCTGFSGVPSTYAILCSKTDFLARPHAHLRYITQAGGAMAPALVRRIREALPARIEVFVMYGQTEACARLSYLPPARLLEKLGSIGIGIPGVSLTVRREDGSECDEGEVGEIVAAGDNIMRGYWNDPAETDKVLRQGRLHTGDLGRRDADGFIFVVDRLKNMIKSGAHRVSSKEIEETILELPGVVEACAIGVPDDLLGEAIEVYVVRRDDQSVEAQAILRHCHEKLAKFKLPRAVHFIPTLPKNSFGKVIKNELKGQRAG